MATEQDQTFSATYQVNTALLANYIPVYGPYVAPSIQSHWNPTVTQQTVSQPPQRPTIVDFSIKVINPERKRDAKNFVLRAIEPETLETVESLREEILEQLGENVASFQLNFDVSYMAGNQRICFKEKDKIGPQLLKLAENDSQLWCEGLSSKPHKHARSGSIVIDSSGSDDDNRPTKARKKRRYRLWTRKLREFKILQTSYKPNMGILSTEFSTSCGQRLWM